MISTLKFNIFHSYGLDILEKLIKTGMADGFSFPHSYFHTPGEIVSELSSVGFTNISTLAVEGVGNIIGDYRLPTDEKDAERMLKCIELTESIPELLGVSRNIIAVGKKIY